MAIAHKMLVDAYHMLRDRVPYADLGDDYLDKRDKSRTVASLLSRLRKLGVDVTVASSSPPAAA